MRILDLLFVICFVSFNGHVDYRACFVCGKSRVQISDRPNLKHCCKCIASASTFKQILVGVLSWHYVVEICPDNSLHASA